MNDFGDFNDGWARDADLNPPRVETFFVSIRNHAGAAVFGAEIARTAPVGQALFMMAQRGISADDLDLTGMPAGHLGLILADRLTIRRSAFDRTAKVRRLWDCVVEDCRFDGSIERRATLAGTVFRRCSFRFCDFTDAILADEQTEPDGVPTGVRVARFEDCVFEDCVAAPAPRWRDRVRALASFLPFRGRA